MSDYKLAYEAPAINVSFDRTGPVTSATVWPDNSSMAAGLVGHGKATLNPNDIDIPEVGEGIAAARALIDIGQQLEKIWHDRAVPKPTLPTWDEITAEFEKVLAEFEKAPIPAPLTKAETIPGRDEDAIVYVHTGLGVSVPVAVVAMDAETLIDALQKSGLSVEIGQKV